MSYELWVMGYEPSSANRSKAKLTEGDESENIVGS